jgi:hypothetical protein
MIKLTKNQISILKLDLFKILKDKYKTKLFLKATIDEIEGKDYFDKTKDIEIGKQFTKTNSPILITF